ncbi:hypothetical protein BGP_1876 [Beggiatoa sp. PS]|nr:hypothetical protein BGP_1876 [Beggiatoa sp. PS]
MVKPMIMFTTVPMIFMVSTPNRVSHFSAKVKIKNITERGARISIPNITSFMLSVLKMSSVLIWMNGFIC